MSLRRVKINRPKECAPGGPALNLNKGDMKLLLAELGQYLRQVRYFIRDPEIISTEDLRHKMAYLSNLSQVVRLQYFEMEKAIGQDESSHRLYHGLGTVCALIHRISELGLNVVRQVGHLSAPSFLDDYELDEFFDEIDFGLSLIGPALEQRKFKLVVRMCQTEEQLDALYANRFRRLIREMDEGLGQPGDRVTTLMLVHYLERIGDLILEIGEQLINVILGENLRYSQYQALTAGLKASGQAVPGLAGFQSIWTGRSGCRICLVGCEEGGAGGNQLIFKHGPAAKLEKERDNLEAWAGLWPGLAPRLISFMPGEGDGQAAMLLEYIRGETLREMFLNYHSFPKVRDELAGALNLMAGLWAETRDNKEIRAGFARQAEKRLGSVAALYPDIVAFDGAIGQLKIRALGDLLDDARRLERELAAPFAVRIHGDFNLSNIMRDAGSGSYRLIDLYRSRLSDYTQDLSVMILSILRLPLSGQAERDFLSGAAVQVWDFARNFAEVNDDPTAEARLSFGLARSFLTSARFEPRRSVAARFLGYSRHLWTKLVEYGQADRPWMDFKLDKRVLYV